MYDFVECNIQKQNKLIELSKILEYQRYPKELIQMGCEILVYKLYTPNLTKTVFNRFFLSVYLISCNFSRVQVKVLKSCYLYIS